MYRFTWRAVVVAVTLAVALSVGIGSAQANPTRVTEGDARAIFQAQPVGGWAVLLHAGKVEAAPADFFPGSLARIGPGLVFDGSHYCSLDWHVINFLFADGNAAGESRTNTEIRNFLSQVDLVFTLDGAPLETVRTPIKPFLNPDFLGVVEAYGFVEGQVMAPEDLAVGAHTLQMTILIPGLPPVVLDPITFFIDAPGEGACL